MYYKQALQNSRVHGILILELLIVVSHILEAP